MHSSRWTIVGALAVSLIAVGIFWAMLPEAGPPTVAKAPAADVAVARRAPADAPARAVRPSPRPTRRAARTKGKARGKAQRAADAGERRAPRARDLEGKDVPEDVVALMEEIRAERVAQSEDRLTTYALMANWDDETAMQVQGLVQTAHDEVDALLVDATEGTVPWSEVRDEVRRIRLDQARAVRDELGEEEFRRFAKAMGRSHGRKRGRR